MVNVINISANKNDISLYVSEDVLNELNIKHHKACVKYKYSDIDYD